MSHPFDLPTFCIPARRTCIRGGVNSAVSGWVPALLVLLLCVCGVQAQAQGIRASAALSQSTTGISEPVKLRVVLSGTRGESQPPAFEVEGLKIRFVRNQPARSFVLGTSGFHTSVTNTFYYEVTPQRAGVFTIPALKLEVEGEQVETEPVTLTVQSDSDNPGGGGGAQKPERLAWAETVLPKTTAYVGETLPVEVRLYVDARLGSQVENPPQIAGEGFTKSAMTAPRQERARKEGREFNVTVLRTAITPGKAGRVRIEPAAFQFIMEIPRARPNRARPAWGNEYFGEGFFDDADAFGSSREIERRVEKAEAVELEVKALPATGRPPGFSGAIGEFTLAVAGNPAAVKIGDPITMKVTVSGKGNFDRVAAPALTEPAGWRVYPPTAGFQRADELGVRGEKTFELAVIPEAMKTAMPVFAFSYFDPATERYATLTSSPAPLSVEGQALPSPAIAQETSGSSRPGSDPARKPDTAPVRATDILGIRYDFGPPVSSRPLHERRGFWLAQAVPLVALFGVLARRRKPDDTARQRATWQRERAERLAQVRRETGGTAFYEAAARVLQLDLSLATGRPPDTIGAAAVREQLGKDGEDAAIIDEIFEARAQVLYAGGDSGEVRLCDDVRARILSILQG